MEIKGKYTQAKVFASVVEAEAVNQIKFMCDFKAFEGAKVRVMPDVHTGVSCTIGTTMTVRDKIVPNMVGVDIGCGMELAEISEREIDYPKLDEIIKVNVPAGYNVRKTAHFFSHNIDLSALRCYNKVKVALAYKSIGTLGGGNHFIEIDEDENGTKYVVVHSGSRHLGVEVANYYQNMAYRELSGNSPSKISELIAQMKEQGRHKEIQSALEALKNSTAQILPQMAYVEGQLFDDYVHDMKIVQQFAIVNRKAIINEIVKGMGFHITDGFTTIHNYIDTENMILRKGAVSAQKGERLLIPINMRDGSLVCVGKGNADWNYSAPHGAGRLMSRAKAFQTLNMTEFKIKMQGIYSTSITETTLDESPMAYKSLEDIVCNIEPTVEIVKRITPVYNFKSTEAR
ncbi:MAG: RtcB family protein [Clostridia bacterium]|nr:RtcB family protein [Clostridia bacterium]